MKVGRVEALTIEPAWDCEDRATLDELKPCPSLVRVASLGEFVFRHPSLQGRTGSTGGCLKSLRTLTTASRQEVSNGTT